MRGSVCVRHHCADTEQGMLRDGSSVGVGDTVQHHG